MKEYTDKQIKFMDGIFMICEASEGDGMTIGDMADIMEESVSDGWDMILISLVMSIQAVRYASGGTSPAAEKLLLALASSFKQKSP